MDATDLLIKRLDKRGVNASLAPVIKIVQISFAGNMEVLYDFFTDLELQVGDPVVCDTVRGYSVGKVVDIIERSSKATNWIVQKVDVEGHKRRLQRERDREIEEMLG